MDIDEILKMNPNSECKVHFTFTEEWKNCYYQLKNEANKDLDPNDLPALDDEYINDTGEPLYNDDDQEVFDPTQEIEYELYYPVEQTDVYSSKTFISLLQDKLDELIKSGELSKDSDLSELIEFLDIYPSPDALWEFLGWIGCDDYKHLSSENQYDSLLWCTASQIDEVNLDIWFEELN